MEDKKYQQINNKIAQFANFALIVLSASMIAQLTWQFLPKNARLEPTNPLTNPPDNTAKIALPHTLFGVFREDKKNHTQTKKTLLDLTLMGVLKSENNPLAIIKSGNSTERIYKINDVINASTTLVEIYSKYVILSRDGVEEKLAIKQANFPASKSGAKNSNPQAQKPISRANKTKLKRYLKQLTTRPRKLLSVVRVNPNFNKSGQLNGFVISPGSERALFKQLGFKKNDIILNINNTALTDLSQAIKIRKELSTQTEFDFIIDRDGFIQSLTVNLN